MGFAKSKNSYFIILEEGLIAQGLVVHRTLIPTTAENALRFSDYIRKVVTGGLIIPNQVEVPPLPQEEDLG